MLRSCFREEEEEEVAERLRGCGIAPAGWVRELRRVGEGILSAFSVDGRTKACLKNFEA